MRNDVRPQIVAHLIGAPRCPPQQVLRRVGRLLARLLGQLPAVLTLDRAQQPTQIHQCMLARLRPREPTPNQGRNVVQPVRPLLGLGNSSLTLNSSLCHHDLPFKVIVTLCHWSIYNCSTRALPSAARWVSITSMRVIESGIEISMCGDAPFTSDGSCCRKGGPV